MLTTLLFIPFILQMIVIGIDEVVFHLKRGLPKWERIGHPLDTLSVLACLLFVQWVPYTALTLKWYVGLALLSCLLVTKDEFVHKHHCPAAEQWLHALLFINHPITLAATALMWPSLHGAESVSWISSSSLFSPFLLVQSLSILAFFLYQAIYWNFIWREKA
jgi:hypothetical protein